MLQACNRLQLRLRPCCLLSCLLPPCVPAVLQACLNDLLTLVFCCLLQIVELVPGGRDVKVTEANKHEYVNLIARHRMTTSIKAQIQVSCGLGLCCGRCVALHCSSSGGSLPGGC